MSSYDDLLHSNFKVALEAMSTRLHPARPETPPANLPPPSAPNKGTPK